MLRQIILFIMTQYVNTHAQKSRNISVFDETGQIYRTRQLAYLLRVPQPLLWIKWNCFSKYLLWICIIGGRSFRVNNALQIITFDRSAERAKVFIKCSCKLHTIDIQDHSIYQLAKYRCYRVNTDSGRCPLDGERLRQIIHTSSCCARVSATYIHRGVPSCYSKRQSSKSIIVKKTANEEHR